MSNAFAVAGATVLTTLDTLPGQTVVVADGAIAWLGPDTDVPARWRDVTRVEAAGRLVTPGLVECHAALLLADEDTSAAPDDELIARATEHARTLIRSGVTQLDVTTGDSTSCRQAQRLLGLARRLAHSLPVDVHVTLLAASGYPAGLDTEEREQFVLDICDELLPAVAAVGGYDAVEVYCEDEDGLSMEDSSTILETVYRRKIPTRVAADRLSDSAGGALAPAFYAKAAFHLDFTDDVAIKAMGNAGTTAVLVPRPGEEQHPPVALLREHGVPIAVSGDDRSGRVEPPLAAAALAVQLLGLTAEEAIAGITRRAARVLADGSDRGVLALGNAADLALWPVVSLAELLETVPERPDRLWSRGAAIDPVTGALEGSAA